MRWVSFRARATKTPLITDVGINTAAFKIVDRYDIEAIIQFVLSREFHAGDD